MSLRHNKTTPFEVMGQATRREPAVPVPEPQPSVREPYRERGGHGRGESRWAAASDWWARAGAGVPVVLRVPRGVAVLLVVALVGLLVLAYWVGHSRGVGAAAAGVEQVNGAEGAPVRLAPGGGDGNGTSEGAGNTNLAAPVDPRVPGRNYIVLATYPPASAQELATWLREKHGVATVLQPAQNGRSRAVIAVDHGFVRAELHGDKYNAWLKRLRTVGRAWQAHTKGSDSFDSMFPLLYNGPQGS